MNAPFLLKPAAKDYLWGGSRLNDDFAKGIDMSPLAETWECSTHPDGESVVASTGETLSEVLRKHPSYLGMHAADVAGGQLPILIKLIDAKRDLSVQVHPDDTYALEHEGSLGKTEMWYVLDACKGARLVYGFSRDVTDQEVREGIRSGNISRCLNSVSVHKGDVFFIKPGTVHAIGAGVLVAEIQENSNVTYRLYDYGRIDKTGRQRELHVDKALDVARLVASDVPRQSMRVVRYHRGCASEALARCKYFQCDRMILNTESYRELTDFQSGGNSFHALLCVDGCGTVFGGATTINFFKGDCIFVPAHSIPLKLHGKAQLLDVSC